MRGFCNPAANVRLTVLRLRFATLLALFGALRLIDARRTLRLAGARRRFFFLLNSPIPALLRCAFSLRSNAARLSLRFAMSVSEFEVYLSISKKFFYFFSSFLKWVSVSFIKAVFSYILQISLHYRKKIDR